MAEFWKMIAWLLKEHFGIFLAVCALAAVWLSALAMILDYFFGWLNARIIVNRDRQKYRCINDEF